MTDCDVSDMHIIEAMSFTPRGPLTPETRRHLACRGSGVALRDTWGRLGWDQEGGAAGVVAEITPVTGAVRGLRWATAGAVVSGTFKLHRLEEDLENIAAHVVVRGEDLVWPNGGDRPRNISDWVELGPEQISYSRKEDGRMIKLGHAEAAAQWGVGQYYLRVSLSLLEVDQMMVSAHVIGGTVNLDRLAAITRDWGLTAGVNAATIPTVGVRAEGTTQTTAELFLVGTEPDELGLGFGLLPVLEEVSEEITPVDRDTLERELCLFLRDTGAACNVTHWREAMAAEAAPPSRTLGVEWPGYRGPSHQGDPTGNRVGRGEGAFIPSAVRNGKYGPQGEYTEVALEAYEIPETLRGHLSGALNASVAKNTWRAYGAAYRAFAASLLEHDVPPPSVISVRHLLIFIGSMIAEGKTASTMRTYISGIRKVAEARGGGFSEEDMRLVQAAVKGKAHTETQRPQRVMMTVSLMMHLKRGLAAVRGPGWSRHNKRALWLLAAWLFWSSCRGGEMAMEREEEFDPNNHLLWTDVVPSEDGESITLTLRAPKEVKGLRKVTVEMFMVGGDLCPVEAWKKFLGHNQLGREPGLPVFRWDSGRNITLQKLNTLLKTFLGDKVDYTEGKLGVHCFRNAILSLMKEGGWAEEAIQAQGRWTSEAFRAYLRRNRKTRREERQRLAGEINREARRA